MYRQSVEQVSAARKTKKALIFFDLKKEKRNNSKTA
jgi:hypothetical protein